MPVIMKNAVYARKTLAKKARSQLLEHSRQENAKILGKTKTNICHYVTYLFDVVVMFCMVSCTYIVIYVNICMVV